MGTLFCISSMNLHQHPPVVQCKCSRLSCFMAIKKRFANVDATSLHGSSSILETIFSHPIVMWVKLIFHRSKLADQLPSRSCARENDLFPGGAIRGRESQQRREIEREREWGKKNHLPVILAEQSCFLFGSLGIAGAKHLYLRGVNNILGSLWSVFISADRVRRWLWGVEW